MWALINILFNPQMTMGSLSLLVVEKNILLDIFLAVFNGHPSCFTDLLINPKVCLVPTERRDASAPHCVRPHLLDQIRSPSDSPTLRADPRPAKSVAQGARALSTCATLRPRANSSFEGAADASRPTHAENSRRRSIRIPTNGGGGGAHWKWSS